MLYGTNYGWSRTDRVTEVDPGFIEKFPAPRDRARYLPRISLRRKPGRPSEESNSSKSQPSEGTIAGLNPAKGDETPPETQVEPAMFELRPRGSTKPSWSARAIAKEKAGNMIARFNDGEQQLSQTFRLRFDQRRWGFLPNTT